MQRPVTLTEDSESRLDSLKSNDAAADLVRMTVNPTSGTNASHANQVNQTSQQAARQAQNKAQIRQSGALPQDKVSLTHSLPQNAPTPKNTGDTDRQGGSH